MDKDYKTLPSESDWEFARKVCDKLELFYDVTELFSGAKYPTSNLFFEKVCDIKVGISNWMLDDDAFIRDMAKSMMTKFEKYWSTIHDVLAIAAVFDPRYKFTLLECYFPDIYGVESRACIESVRQLLVELEKDYKKLNVDGSQEGNPSHDGSSISQGGGRMTAYDRYVASLTTSFVDVETELDGYLKEKVLPKTAGSDILLWWKANESKYPTLALIAKTYLPFQ
ncbi:unnamed protein product [Linum trigynum]|uniref:Transposase n=1 Tax=Linum trigynum TaxID=586398 RepID=A0AAV2CTA4_9ROSI